MNFLDNRYEGGHFYMERVNIFEREKAEYEVRDQRTRRTIGRVVREWKEEGDPLWKWKGSLCEVREDVPLRDSPLEAGLEVWRAASPVPAH